MLHPRLPRAVKPRRVGQGQILWTEQRPMKKTLQHRPKPDREVLWSGGLAAGACSVRWCSIIIAVASIATTLHVNIVFRRDDSALVLQVISAIEGV